MKNIQINLLDKPTEYNFMPYMDTYILDGEKRPMVVICPGGGYVGFTRREAERIAVSYNAAGFHAVVVNYCRAPHKFPAALKNVASVISMIRDNADEWDVDIQKIFVCGFSAGGHLAASISTLWNNKNVFSSEEIAKGMHKPNGTILGYPVITSGEYAHKESVLSLLQEDKDDTELWEMMSLEKQIDSETPPAFIWHTVKDSVVPVENSFLYAWGLQRNGILYELHIFDKGEHGLSLTSDETIWSKRKFEREYPWLKLSVDWINNLQ